MNVARKENDGVKQTAQKEADAGKTPPRKAAGAARGGGRSPLLLLLGLLALVAALWSYLAIAQQQESLDRRAWYVAEQIKCPVCQDESIADSQVAIATQMRQVVRQQLSEGKSEQQVLQYFSDHYGRQILLTPPQQGLGFLAWWMPVAMK